MATAHAVFPVGRGVTWWTERNATSPIPGLWPYGLEHLGDGSLTVEPVEVAELGPISRRLALRRGVRRRRATGTDPDIAFAWDESTATRMVAQVRAKRMYAGVIWATDQLVRGERSEALELQRSALRQLDGVWVLSRPQVEPVRRWLGPDSPPVHFLPFGVDPAFYRCTPYPSGSDQAPLIVSIGGDRDRDPDTLFAALRLVLAERPDVRCIVQTSTEHETVPGIETRSFIPHAEVRDLYAMAAVVPIAVRENLHVSGMTVGMEALSCGRPVVTCATPGMADYILPGITGELVRVGDAAGMAGQILRLLADPTRAAALGEAGRQFIEQSGTSTTMCCHLRSMMSA